MAHCLHCGSDVPVDAAPEEAFCCAGCKAAYDLVNGLGLEGYYRRRVIDPAQRPLKPEEDSPEIDYATYVRDEAGGVRSLSLMVEGLHCAACVWLIESVLARQPGVVAARVNMTTRRLTLTWRSNETDADTLTDSVNRLGYRLVPYDPALIGRESERREKKLLRAMAVAGFAAGNVMLLSVSVWAGQFQGMEPATRDLFHWISALIVLPAIAYAGVPFFRSALSVLAAGRVNMDVPISLAVVLAAAMSVYQTAAGAEHAYFDSAIALLFFLLVGRYLDTRARGRARSSAENLLALGAAAVTVIERSGRKRILPPSRVEPGMTALAATGERIPVDGEVVDGVSDIDTGLIDGESMPKPAAPGTRVFAGTLNLSAPLTLTVTAVGEDTLLAEIARLIEAAERERGRYVVLADRVARLYAPVVHGLALLTFGGWWLVLGATWQTALLNAIAVLIITCPCALALAVPVVQVIASGRLLRRGVLVKSGTAFERLAAVDTVVFDKTGTLTEGRPELVNGDRGDEDAFATATALATASKHPLARALVRAAANRVPTLPPFRGVREVAGRGLEADIAEGVVRLGSREFCGIDEGRESSGPELWLVRPGAPPARFLFADRARTDATEVIAALKARRLRLAILSGDRRPVVEAIAGDVDIDDWRAGCAPADKVRRLEALAGEGRRVLMVGDGLNDAPALAAAHVSMSPSTAVDVAQTAADAVFQGAKLAPVVETLDIARRAGRLIKQNLVLAFLYNGITIPLAITGLVTPLFAAIAMSASSLVVIVNALRLNRGKAF
jgi:Cu2+-exporting ATPase